MSDTLYLQLCTAKVMSVPDFVIPTSVDLFCCDACLAVVASYFWSLGCFDVTLPHYLRSRPPLSSAVVVVARSSGVSFPFA